MSTTEKSLDELDDDYTKKKVSYDSLPTFKREMKDRYDQVRNLTVKDHPLF